MGLDVEVMFRLHAMIQYQFKCARKSDRDRESEREGGRERERVCERERMRVKE